MQIRSTVAAASSSSSTWARRGGIVDDAKCRRLLGGLPELELRTALPDYESAMQVGRTMLEASGSCSERPFSSLRFLLPWTKFRKLQTSTVLLSAQARPWGELFLAVIV